MSASTRVSVFYTLHFSLPVENQWPWSWGGLGVRIFLTLARHDSCMAHVSRARVPCFPLSKLVFPFYRLGAIFASCPCFYFSSSFITCGFGEGYLRALALFSLHLASLLSRGHVVPFFGMVLVQGCPRGALLRLC